MMYITALAPVITLILTGYILKRIQFLSVETWAGIEKLTYFLLFPALLIYSLGKQNIAGIPWQAIFIISGVTITLSAIVLVIFRRLLTQDSSTFTSIFQGGVRFNTYIILAVALALYGEKGLALGSVAVGFMILVSNLLCILIFMLWGNLKRKDNQRAITSILYGIFSNPLIIACLTGWMLSLSGIGLPTLAADILEIISRAALPLGLLVVGAALRLKGIKEHLPPIIYASLVQFIFKPLVVAWLLLYFELDPVSSAVLIIAFIVPTAPAAYVLARQLGGDTESMAAIITVQTLLAFLLMPLLSMLLL